MAGFHKKTQELAKKERSFEAELGGLRQDQKIFSELLNTDWFKKAAAAERARKSGVSDEMSDDGGAQPLGVT